MSKSKTKHKPGIHLFNIRRLKPARKKKGEKQKLVMADNWFWHIVSKNGRIIARSSEIYTRKGNAVKSIATAAMIFAPDAINNLYYDHSKPNMPLQSYL